MPHSFQETSILHPDSRRDAPQALLPAASRLRPPDVGEFAVSRCLTESPPGCRPGGKLKHALPLQTPMICRISFSLSRRAGLAPARRAVREARDWLKSISRPHRNSGATSGVRRLLSAQIGHEEWLGKSAEPADMSVCATPSHRQSLGKTAAVSKLCGISLQPAFTHGRMRFVLAKRSDASPSLASSAKLMVIPHDSAN
jgi:hypothetical protein